MCYMGIRHIYVEKMLDKDATLSWKKEKERDKKRCYIDVDQMLHWGRGEEFQAYQERVVEMLHWGMPHLCGRDREM